MGSIIGLVVQKNAKTTGAGPERPRKKSGRAAVFPLGGAESAARLPSGRRGYGVSDRQCQVGEVA